MRSDLLVKFRILRTFHYLLDSSHLWEAISPVIGLEKVISCRCSSSKRICDVWDEVCRHVVTYGEDFEDEHRFPGAKRLSLE